MLMPRRSKRNGRNGTTRLSGRGCGRKNLWRSADRIASVLVSDFSFHLPEELIAQEPAADRAGSRMLTLDRKTGGWEDRQFRDFPASLEPGDLLVLNDS